MLNTTRARPLRRIALSFAICLIVCCGFSNCRPFQQEPRDLSVEEVGARAAIAPEKLSDAELARVVRTAAQRQAVSEADARRLAAIYAAHVNQFATVFYARTADAPASFTSAEAESYLRVTAQHKSAHNDLRRATQAEIGRRLADAVPAQEFPPSVRVLAASTADFARAVARALTSVAQPTQAHPSQTQSSAVMEDSVNGTINSLYYNSIATLRGEGATEQKSDPVEESAARRWGAKHATFYASVMVAQRRAREGDERAARFISALRQYDEALVGDDEKILAPDGLPLAPSTLKETQRTSLEDATSGIAARVVRAAGGERLANQQAAAYRIAEVTVPLLTEFSNYVGN